MLFKVTRLKYDTPKMIATAGNGLEPCVEPLTADKEQWTESTFDGTINYADLCDK